MIKYRQKNFIAPLAALGALNGSGAVGGAMNLGILGTSAWGLKQGKDQMEQSEKQAEEMAEQNRAMTRALNRIAKNAAKNPQLSQDVSNVLTQKQYAAPSSGFIKGITGLGKDIYGMIGPQSIKFAKTGIIGGTAIAGSSYVANKLIEKDAKKIGMSLEPIPGESSQKQYAEPAKNSIMSNIGKYGKKAAKGVWNNKGELGFGALFGGVLPTFSYISERQQYLDQINSTQNSNFNSPVQKNYAVSASAFKGLGKWFKYNPKGTGAWNTFLEDPGKTILGGISKFTSFGNFGKKEVDSFAKGLAKKGKANGNIYTQKTGEFLDKHPYLALGGAIGTGMGATAATYGLSEKLTRKGASLLDKDAFKYEKSRGMID